LYAFNLYTRSDYGLVLSRNMLLSSSLPDTWFCLTDKYWFLY